MNHVRLSSLSLALALGAAAPLGAQQLAPEQYEGLRARHIGPVGNRVSSVAGVPGDRNTYFAGAATGGIWKTDDAGLHWRPVFDDQPVHAIGAPGRGPERPRDRLGGDRGRPRSAPTSRSETASGSRPTAARAGSHMGLEGTGRVGRILNPPPGRRHRVRRGARPRLRGVRRARGVPDDGRRRLVGEGPVRRPRDRRLRHGHGSRESAEDLRDHVGHRSQDVEARQRGPGQRAPPDHGRRRQLDGTRGERAPHRHARKDRRLHVRLGLRPASTPSSRRATAYRWKATRPTPESCGAATTAAARGVS